MKIRYMSGGEMIEVYVMDEGVNRIYATKPGEVQDWPIGFGCTRGIVLRHDHGGQEWIDIGAIKSPSC